MKYEIGDKIILLYTEEEGTVVDIINEKMVMIEIKGVRFPAYMDQIDFPYYKMFTQKKPVEKKKIHIEQLKKEKPVKKIKTGKGVWIRFFPVYDKDIFDDDLVEKLKVYLENQEDIDFEFRYQLYFGTDVHFDMSTTLHGLSDCYLHDIEFDDLSEHPRFAFDFNLVKEQKNKADHFEAMLKKTGKQFFKFLETCKAANEPSFAFCLFEQYPDKEKPAGLNMGKLEKAGFRMYEASKARQHMQPARSVVDLHIEKITDHWQNLSSQDMMSMQLSHFEKYFELAVAHHLPDMIFIHGVGEGRLRDEIHQRLRQKDEVKTFVHQYHPLYGYGATEVFFQY